MRNESIKAQFSVHAAAAVIWALVAVVICYGSSVWLAIAITGPDRLLESFGGNRYALAGVLAAAAMAAAGVAFVFRRK